jgi:outer membrane lipoprotein-sorting protein
VTRLHATLGLALATLAAGANAQERDWQSKLPALLKRALAVSQTSRYSGERVVEFKDRSERRSFREFIWKDGTRLRIEYGEGPMKGQIVVEKGDRRYHYRPESNEIELGPARRDEALSRLTGFLRRGKGVKLETASGGNVAGYATTRINFVDSRGNTMQSLWIEQSSAVILKRELYDPVGAVYGSFEFKKINLAPRFRNSDFEIRRAGAVEVTPKDIARRLMKQGGFLPVFLQGEGLELDASRMVGPKGDQAVQLIYRSRQGPISLLQHRKDVKLPLIDRKLEDRLKVYRWEYKGRNFVLIGPLPEDQLRRLAQGAREL